LGSCSGRGGEGVHYGAGVVGHLVTSLMKGMKRRVLLRAALRVPETAGHGPARQEGSCPMKRAAI
ncbi:MAG: hypothetical protein Q7U42_09090, partial [Parvibaculum sp.]|nr:hypothetical protein [Parvibaculum sp.]